MLVGVPVHVCTCTTHFYMLGMTVWIALKFSLWLVIDFPGTMQRKSMKHLRVQTLFPFSRPLVHRRIRHLPGFRITITKSVVPILISSPVPDWALKHVLRGNRDHGRQVGPLRQVKCRHLSRKNKKYINHSSLFHTVITSWEG